MKFLDIYKEILKENYHIVNTSSDNQNIYLYFYKTKSELTAKEKPHCIHLGFSNAVITSIEASDPIYSCDMWDMILKCFLYKTKMEFKDKK